MNSAASGERQRACAATRTITAVKALHFGQLLTRCALWGASFPFIRIAAAVMPPWVLALATRAVLMRVLRHSGALTGAAGIRHTPRQAPPTRPTTG